jgi:hypothetical protein
MSNTTKVVGYYNGNRWPIQVVASKFNVTLTLKPGEYVLDRQGRKINDPYFEVFANNKQLHRELSENPVPLITIPEVTSAAVVTQPNNPVKAVTQWTRDAKGHRQPVIPEQQQQPTTLPAAVMASASDAVRPMTMDEARKAGFVRKVREVPEDYGVNDTTGLPPGGIPKMKYSIDPSVNKPAPPLPKEMLALPKDDPNRQTRAQLVAGLAQGTRTPAPEDAPTNPFANAGVSNASPLVAGNPIVESAEPEPQETLPEAEPQETMPEPGLPDPELEEASAPAPVAPVAAAPPLRPLTPKNRFTCPMCGAPHKFRSQLLNHATAKHPDRVNAIMANYPETAPEPPPLS